MVLRPERNKGMTMATMATTQSQRAVDTGEQRYRLLLENANDAVYVHELYPDRPGRFREVNARACQMLGYTQAELLAMEVREIDVPEQAERLGAIIAELQRSGRALFETEHVAKDGRRIPVEVSTRLFDLNGTPTVLSVVRDVSEHRSAAEALRRSEARHVTFLNATDDIAFLKDADLRYVLSNQANADFLGTTIDSIVGRTDEDLMLPDVAAACRASDLRALAESQTIVEEERAGDRVYEVHKFPVPLEDGRTGVGAYVRDITERKLAAAALEESAVRLRATLNDTVRVMGEIVGLRDPYTASHERNVTRLAGAIAAELGLDGEAREGLVLACEVHDIGKIAVPAEILSKPSALTAMERRIVEEHPVVARSVLSGIRFPQPVADIVGQHHERLDGSGYPNALSGSAILPEARILAVADVVEAMASHRPYRPALGIEAALAEVRDGAGVRYDAEAVAACERVMAAGFDIDA